MQKVSIVTDQTSLTPTIRRPRQKRSRERFEAILDSAERLLAGHEPHTISIYTIAAEAELTPPSIYHFFADADGVFYALAERYYAGFAEGFKVRPYREFASWQDLSDFRSTASVAFYNANPAARKLLLGSGLSASMRARDLSLDRELAKMMIDDLNHYFKVPDLPELEDRVTETLVLNDALWALSVHQYGTITPKLAEQAKLARLAYSSTYLPQRLVSRELGNSDDTGTL